MSLSPRGHIGALMATHDERTHRLDGAAAHVSAAHVSAAQTPETKAGERRGARCSPELESTVAMVVVRDLVEVVDKMGVPCARFVRAAGLRAEDLENACLRVPSAELDRIATLAISMTGDPALGLHWAERFSQRSFGPVSHLVVYAVTLRHALASLSQFGRLFHDEPKFALHERDACAELRVPSCTGRSPALQRLEVEMIAASLLRLTRALCPRAQMLEANFAYPAPPHEAEYARIFGPVVRFEQGASGLVFDRALLDVASPNRDDDIRAALSPLAEERLMRSLGAEPCTRKLYSLMLRDVPRRMRMRTAARLLGFSERSLRRHLAAEGSSFFDVERRVFASYSKRLLCDERHSIQETAFKLGFSDASAFHRAFKRWTGTTPTAFLANHRGCGDAAE